jgi:hypothetical protein
MAMSDREYWAAMDYWTSEREQFMAKLGWYYKNGTWVR